MEAAFLPALDKDHYPVGVAPVPTRSGPQVTNPARLPRLDSLCAMPGGLPLWAASAPWRRGVAAGTRDRCSLTVTAGAGSCDGLNEFNFR